MIDASETLTNELNNALKVWLTIPQSFESGQVERDLKKIFGTASSSDALDAVITCLQTVTDPQEKTFFFARIAPNFNKWVMPSILMHEAKDLHERAIFADLQGLPWLKIFRQASEKAYNSYKISPDDSSEEETSYVLGLLRTAHAPNPKINY